MVFYSMPLLLLSFQHTMITQKTDQGQEGQAQNGKVITAHLGKQLGTDAFKLITTDTVKDAILR